MTVQVAKGNVICIYLISVFLRLHTGKPGWPVLDTKRDTEEADNTYILYISYIIS
jgi:hypothetical protein